MLFLDTNVVVDVVRKNRPEVRRRYAEVRAAGKDLAIPTPVLFELRIGVKLSPNFAESHKALDVILAEGVVIVDFDADDAEEAAEIGADLRKSGRTIGPYDLLIAAQARRRAATLVTHNVRAFARVPGLIVVDWVD